MSRRKEKKEVREEEEHDEEQKGTDEESEDSEEKKDDSDADDAEMADSAEEGKAEQPPMSRVTLGISAFRCRISFSACFALSLIVVTSICISVKLSKCYVLTTFIEAFPHRIYRVFVKYCAVILRIVRIYIHNFPKKAKTLVSITLPIDQFSWLVLM